MCKQNQMNKSDGTMSSGEQLEQQDLGPSKSAVVSLRVWVISLLASSLLAFSLGKATRMSWRLDNGIQQEDEKVWNESALSHSTGQHHHSSETPQSRYLSKNLDDMFTSDSSSFWLASNRDTVKSIEEKLDANCSETDNEDGAGGQQDNEEPTAEHLMVDIQNVNVDFLNSKRRLADAMMEVARAANLTMLSYHCHGLIPTGVSCVGVLTRNYVLLHTWPAEGVISIDFCTGDSKSLLPVVPLMERAFGVPRSSHKDGPKMIWSKMNRGFPKDQSVTDVDRDVMKGLSKDVKELVASVRTDFQTIDVFDVAKTNALENVYDNRPNRNVYLDGAHQSSLLSEAVYHEALVHPGLFAHANPKRVAIIGGGECATLREVLKHKTVEEAIMIEIDEMMVNESRKYMPEWSDCGDIEGSTSWCVDDSRANMYYEDALAWFVDRYSEGESKIEESPGQIDVIIMDALDPESEVHFAEALYNNETFMQSFFNSLGKDGILVMQLGNSAKYHSPDETLTKFKNRVGVMNMLEKIGFKSIHVYEEGECGFGDPWTFIVAFKAYEMRKRWFRTEAEINLEMSKRAKRTVSGRNSFLFFDGATMKAYQVPPRQVETVFCRRRPVPLECIGDAYNSYNYSHSGTSVFNPVIDRHLSSLGRDMSIMRINAGIEIVNTYQTLVERSLE